MRLKTPLQTLEAIVTFHDNMKAYLRVKRTILLFYIHFNLRSIFRLADLKAKSLKLNFKSQRHESNERLKINSNFL